MQSHTFAPDALPQLVVDLTPPAGATACIIKFTATQPTAAATAPGPAGGVRLAHVRLIHPTKHPHQSADHVLPRETEIVELIFRNGTPTAGFSGFGGKKAVHPVQHMGEVPTSFPVVISLPLNGKDVTVSAGGHTAMSDTDIAPGDRPMELLLGMQPLPHGDGVNTLSPPMGWTVEWQDDAVTWLNAGDTPKTAGA